MTSNLFEIAKTIVQADAVAKGYIKPAPTETTLERLYREVTAYYAAHDDDPGDCLYDAVQSLQSAVEHERRAIREARLDNLA